MYTANKILNWILAITSPYFMIFSLIIVVMHNANMYDYFTGPSLTGDAERNIDIFYYIALSALIVLSARILLLKVAPIYLEAIGVRKKIERRTRKSIDTQSILKLLIRFILVLGILYLSATHALHNGFGTFFKVELNQYTSHPGLIFPIPKEIDFNFDEKAKVELEFFDFQEWTASSINSGAIFNIIMASPQYYITGPSITGDDDDSPPTINEKLEYINNIVSATIQFERLHASGFYDNFSVLTDTQMQDDASSLRSIYKMQKKMDIDLFYEYLVKAKKNLNDYNAISKLKENLTHRIGCNKDAENRSEKENQKCNSAAMTIAFLGYMQIMFPEEHADAQKEDL